MERVGSSPPGIGETAGRLPETSLRRALPMRDLDRDTRRASGVYYTPAVLIDHILPQTLGRRLQGKTPREAARLRILDPACGSGFFLLRVYQYLLDWYRQQYGRQLTPAQRQRILREQLFGVDIDPQATAAARRAL